ncbi:hypothetical protein [Asticcacaulis sp. YBE204]|uniref:hypothetical protein n=1 Tax=Asticcacaulis sp. YBE204 TaxID=1282363 RepID=UPI0003C3D516|nr:hypothetical protein [Asticcacaulis sp. YBE204]ESQ81358.1 hypothetical protein AEYBE204_03175 [Asticcacaulis sp. YBE204]
MFKGLVQAAAVVSLLFGAGSVSAAELKADVVKAPYAGLAAPLKGDFDGDGRQDDVWFSQDDDARQSVYIRLNRAEGAEDLKVMSLDAKLTPQAQRAVAADYKVDCGAFADNCTDGVRLTTDGLILSLDEGMTVLIHWTGKGFDQDFIRSDDVRLSRAVATLFALNP